MNTAISKINFIKTEVRLYSWLLNAIETPYQNKSLCCCERYLQEQSLLSR